MIEGREYYPVFLQFNKEVMVVGILMTEERLSSAYNYLRKLADKQHNEHSHRKYGVVEFMYQDMVDDDNSFTTSGNHVSQVMTHLAEKGFATRIKRGGAGTASIWDVSPFLGYGRVKYERPDAEIEVIKKDKPVESYEPFEETIEVNNEPAKQETNNEVLAEISESISGLVTHLQELPEQFNSHLQTLSSRLKILDGSVLEDLQKENNQLHSKVEQLESQLQEAQSQPQFNAEYVERQSELVVKKVDEILNAPWKIGKFRNDFRRDITSRLTNIKKELGIIE